jgi:hypothetical protein
MHMAATDRRTAQALLGRTFVSPAFDYLVIGGGLSLLFTLAIWQQPSGLQLVGAGAFQYILLFSNSAHFAASTVRLYTKPGAVEARPFLSRGLPWVAFSVMVVAVLFAGNLGRAIETVYLAWSPYHYSAQAYGLAVVYSYRSGRSLGTGPKRALWWTSMIPFLYMGTQMLQSRAPASVGQAMPAALSAVAALGTGLVWIGMAAPLLLFAWLWRDRSGPIPLISLLTLISNAIWFFVLNPLDAFLWATVFHGLQYMAIVMIFDVRDQMSQPGNSHGRMFHAVAFYAMSLALGYGLFILLPLGFKLAGFDYYDGRLAAVSVVNIHHFIVDAYIWRLGAKDGNRRIVESAA